MNWDVFKMLQTAEFKPAPCERKINLDLELEDTLAGKEERNFQRI